MVCYLFDIHVISQSCTQLMWRPHAQRASNATAWPPVTSEANATQQELSLFIAANWMELPDAEEGEPYYHNTITGRSQWVEPQPPTKFLLDDEGTMLLAEDEQDRVMPSRKDVTSAGRYDLHHAIVYHGGYRAVSRRTARAPQAQVTNVRGRGNVPESRGCLVNARRGELPADDTFDGASVTVASPM